MSEQGQTPGEDRKPKDNWDKLEKASTFLASVVIAAASLIVTEAFDARQAQRDADLREESRRTQELGIVQGFIGHIVQGGAEADAAILTISALGSDSLAVRLAAVIQRDSALAALLPQLARRNDAALIRTILDVGIPSDVLDEAGNTPLMIAASAGALEAAAILIDGGAQVDARSARTGWTPLHFAAARGRDQVTRELLRRGASAGAVDSQGVDPLWIAAQLGHSTTVSVLASNGVDLEQTDDDGWTPLFVASARGHLDAVLVLLELGADPSHRDVSGDTPLMVAAEAGHLGVVRALVGAGARADVVDASGLSAADRALIYGHDSISAFLLETAF